MQSSVRVEFVDAVAVEIDDRAFDRKVDFHLFARACVVGFADTPFGRDRFTLEGIAAGHGDPLAAGTEIAHQPW